MRRPKSRRPPKLPVHEPEPSAESKPRVFTPKEHLRFARAAGTHPSLGRDEVRSIARRIAADDPRYTFGLDLGPVEVDDVYAVLAEAFGCLLDTPKARIAVDLTLARHAAARERVREVAAAGGRFIFATSRPASLLGVHLALAAEARAAGGTVLSGREVREVRAKGRSDRRISWVGGVAVLTDGESLLAHDDPTVWADVDFEVGRAELVVSDGALGAGALAARFEVVALADLHHVALALAAARDRPVRVVPLVADRPPWSYEPLASLPPLAPPEARSTSPVT